MNNENFIAGIKRAFESNERSKDKLLEIKQPNKRGEIHIDISTRRGPNRDHFNIPGNMTAIDIGYTRERLTGKYKMTVRNPGYGRTGYPSKTFKEFNGGGWNFEGIVNDLLSKLDYSVYKSELRDKQNSGFTHASKLVKDLELDDFTSNMRGKANNDGTVDITFKGLNEEQARAILAKLN